MKSKQSHKLSEETSTDAHHGATRHKERAWWQKGLRILLPLSLSLLILWLLYRDMEWGVLLETLRSDANYLILFVAALFGTLGNTIRGFRWQILNKSLSPSSSLLNSILTTHGNYTMNIVFPRLGEVWRCGAMAHYSGMSFSALFGTLLIDRVLDVVMVALLLLLALLLNGSFFRLFLEHNPAVLLQLQQTFTTPSTYLVLLSLVALVWLLVRLLRRSRLGQKVARQWQLLKEGLRSIQRMQERSLFTFYTVAIFGCYFLQFYLTFFAFSFTSHLTASIALITFVMGSIAVAAPVQAGIGAWHFMVIYSLLFFGIPEAEAQSFALIVHTTQQMIWNPLVGLVSILLLPIVNRGGKVRG